MNRHDFEQFWDQGFKQECFSYRVHLPVCMYLANFPVSRLNTEYPGMKITLVLKKIKCRQAFRAVS